MLSFWCNNELERQGVGLEERATELELQNLGKLAVDCAGKA